MTLGRLLALLILVLVTGYLGSHLYGLIAPPPLELTAPESGLTTSRKTLEIIGKTQPGASVKINGSPILPDQSGEFKQELVLSGGIHTITISARKRYSRAATATRQILILDGQRVSASSPGGI